MYKYTLENQIAFILSICLILIGILALVLKEITLGCIFIIVAIAFFMQFGRAERVELE